MAVDVRVVHCDDGVCGRLLRRKPEEKQSKNENFFLKKGVRLTGKTGESRVSVGGETAVVTFELLPLRDGNQEK